MEEYLSHHGIFGMKWGIRRYQNTDGTLTPAGKERYAKVAADPYLRKSQTEEAIDYYTESSKQAEISADIATVGINRSNRNLERDPTNEKYKSNLNKNKIIREANEKIKAIADTRIEQINSGTFKAGRDFIVQNDWYIDWSGISTETRIIERD